MRLSGIEQIAMDQAALSRGLVPVPYARLREPGKHRLHPPGIPGASLLFVQFGQRWQALAAAAGKPIDNLKRIVCAKLEGAPGLEAYCQRHRRVWIAGSNPHWPLTLRRTSRCSRTILPPTAYISGMSWAAEGRDAVA